MQVKSRWMGLVSYFFAGLAVWLLTGVSGSVVTTVNASYVLPLGKIHQVDVLQQKFVEIDYQWPLAGQSVPPVVVAELPDDLPQLASAAERKGVFLRTLLPLVLLENDWLREKRQRLQQIIDQGGPVNYGEQQWLQQQLGYYRIKGKAADPATRQRLLNRLDELPVALVLAQAAMESGWGTSRFAQQGNSLFGQWSYAANSGLVPESRDEEASHVVKSFDTLQASVRAYMRNLNTHRAYKELRQMRASMRQQSLPLDGMKLAEGLVRYSQRGDEYVEELQVIIRANKLDRYEGLMLEG